MCTIPIDYDGVIKCSYFGFVLNLNTCDIEGTKRCVLDVPALKCVYVFVISVFLCHLQLFCVFLCFAYAVFIF